MNLRAPPSGLRQVLRAGLFIFAGGSLQASAGDPKPPASLDDLLNQKVSAAAKYEQTVREAAASVTIVTSQDIEDFGFATLAELLSSVRSFYVSYDRNYDYAGVRGFSRPTDYNDRILLLVDGHTLNENTYGQAPIGTDVFLPLEAIERVEIVRGPGSALYGTYAMLAVINVVTKTGASIDGGRVSAEAGSFGRKGASFTWGKAYEGGLDLRVAASALDVDGQDLFYPEYVGVGDGDGVARDLDRDRAFGALISARYGKTSVRAGATSRSKRFPTGAYGVDFGDPRSKTRDERQWVDLSQDLPISFDKTLSLRAWADRYFYVGDYPYGALFLDETNGLWAGGEGRFTWDLRSDHRLTIGTEYRHSFQSTYASGDEGSALEETNVRSSAVAVYAQDEVRVYRGLSVTGGLRFDHVSTSGSSLTPRIGLVQNLGTKGAVKLLYGEAFRAPSTYESLFAGEAEGGKLEAERIRTLELTVESKISSWLVGTLSGYRYQMRNLIDPELDSQGEIQYSNAGRVTATGLELQLDARLPGGFRLGMSYGRQRARDDQKTVLTNSPEQVFKASLAGNILGAVTAGLRLRCESSRITVYRTETAPYCVTDLNLTSKAIAGFSLSLNLRNAFDRRYETPGGLEHLQLAIPQDGRSLVGRLTWTF